MLQFNKSTVQGLLKRFEPEQQLKDTSLDTCYLFSVKPVHKEKDRFKYNKKFRMSAILDEFWGHQRVLICRGLFQ